MCMNYEKMGIVQYGYTSCKHAQLGDNVHNVCSSWASLGMIFVRKHDMGFETPLFLQSIYAQLGYIWA